MPNMLTEREKPDDGPDKEIDKGSDSADESGKKKKSKIISWLIIFIITTILVLIGLFVLKHYTKKDPPSSRQTISLPAAVLAETLTVDIGKEWPENWLKPKYKGKLSCNTDGEVDYQMMGARGQIVTMLAIPRPGEDTVRIRGSVDSVRFKLIDENVDSATVKCFVYQR